MTDREQILDWIAEGEHEQQDFKFAINDARKIALSLCSFANTEGGKLLVGVKDNGVICGVRSDEEIHMIDTAADLFTEPPVSYTTHIWEVEGKVVVEVRIPRSAADYHQVRMKDGSSVALVRYRDENRKASPVHLDLWKNRTDTRKPQSIAYSDLERQVLAYIKSHPRSTLNQIQKSLKYPRRKLISFLAQMVRWNVLRMVVANDQFAFELIP